MIKIDHSYYAIKINTRKYVIFNADSHSIFIYKDEVDSFSAPAHQSTVNTIINTDNHTTKKYLSSLTICVSERCNLSCKYCYANGGVYNHVEPHEDMTFEDMKFMFDELIKIYPEGVINCTFFGGEPMLTFSAIVKFVEYVAQQSKKAKAVCPHFSIVTNGTMITKDAWDFFNKWNFSVTISIDGNKEENDCMRVFPNSNASVFDLVSHNITSYGNRSFFMVAEATLGINFFKSYTPGYVREYLGTFNKLGFDSVSPFVAETDDCDINQKSIKSGIKNFYCDLVDYCFSLLLSNDKYAQSPPYILSVIVNILKKQSKRVCSAGKTSLFYTKNGAIYPCQMYYGDSQQVIGNIYEPQKLMCSIKGRKRVSRMDIPECNDCFARNFCTFWCPGGSYMFCGSEKNVDPVRCLVQQVIGESVISWIAQIYESGKSKIFIENIKKLSSYYSIDKYMGSQGQ